MSDKLSMCEAVKEEKEKIYPHSASASGFETIANLLHHIGEDKAKEVMKPITELIDTSIEEGSFSCVIRNDMIEDLFSLDSNSFDDTILQWVINTLRSLGYKVSENELVYGDPSNYIEISWYFKNEQIVSRYY